MFQGNEKAAPHDVALQVKTKQSVSFSPCSRLPFCLSMCVCGWCFTLMSARSTHLLPAAYLVHIQPSTLQSLPSVPVRSLLQPQSSGPLGCCIPVIFFSAFSSSNTSLFSFLFFLPLLVCLPISPPAKLSISHHPFNFGLHHQDYSTNQYPGPIQMGSAPVTAAFCCLKNNCLITSYQTSEVKHWCSSGSQIRSFSEEIQSGR